MSTKTVTCSLATVEKITTYTDMAHADDAQAMLEWLVGMVRPLMEDRGWTVRQVIEMPPDTMQETFGANAFYYKLLYIRLRWPDDYECAGESRDTVSVMVSMVHGLTHFLHIDHDANIRAAFESLFRELEAAILMGRVPFPRPTSCRVGTSVSPERPDQMSLQWLLNPTNIDPVTGLEEPGSFQVVRLRPHLLLQVPSRVCCSPTQYSHLDVRLAPPTVPFFLEQHDAPTISFLVESASQPVDVYNYLADCGFDPDPYHFVVHPLIWRAAPRRKKLPQLQQQEPTQPQQQQKQKPVLRHLAEYEDRAAERARAAEVTARQHAHDLRARARLGETSSSSAAPYQTPTTGYGNAHADIDYHGHHMPSSPPEHHFTDDDDDDDDDHHHQALDDDDEDDDSEVETSYYARAQSQAARVVSFGRGQISPPPPPQFYGRHNVGIEDDDEDVEEEGQEEPEEEVEEEEEEEPEAYHPPATTTRHTRHGSHATETPTNPRDTRHHASQHAFQNQPPPIQRRSTRERTADRDQATPPVRETRHRRAAAAAAADPDIEHHNPSEDDDPQPPPAPSRTTRLRSRGHSTRSTTAASTSPPPPPAAPVRETRQREPRRAAAAAAATTPSASEPVHQPPPAPVRETRLRHHHHQSSSSSSQQPPPQSSATLPPPPASSLPSAMVTPEARTQRSRDERIGVAAPRRGRGG
ncbi:hypothetical protein VTJ04DRAFT_3678 [Mycothermus thermophilus]|uniref:uncharacterized protein n=1 Tax=Humicola insolens TaxID=85995 RepID=UPI0037436873